MQRLTGRVAIVTGAARGIGRAVALGFAAEGASVVFVDVREESARAAAREAQAHGPEALAIGADVTHHTSLERVVSTALDRFGRLDIVHNNAGIVGERLDLFAYTPADWDAILNVNLKAAFFLSQIAARVMIERGTGGVILNTTSTSSFVASSMPIVPYDVSKAGLRQLTVSLAAHLAPHGIRVNAIAPGTVDTDFGETLRGAPAERSERRAAYTARIPLRRIAVPGDLVGAAIFLCSDEAAYVTGHTLVVDGGLLAV